MFSSKASNSDLYFLQGGGEMGALIREKNWHETALGPPQQWPQPLKTLVSVMLDNAFGMYLAWGNDYVALYNDAYRPILGSELHPKALGAPTGITFANIWPLTKPLYASVMQGKSLLMTDYHLPLLRNGYLEDCHFDLSYSPVRLEDGTAGGILVTVMETTEKTKAVRALRESEERFRVMAEGSNILFALSDETSNAIYFNKAWEKLTGRSNIDLLNFGWADLIHPDDRQAFVDHYLQSFARKENWTGQFRMRSNSGQYHWLLAEGVARFHADGAFAGYTGSCIDITHQVNALEQLTESELDLRGIVMEAPVGVCIINAADALIEIANDSYLQITGKRKEEIVGKSVGDSFPEFLEQFQLHFREVVETGVPFRETEAPLTMIRDGKPTLIYASFVYAPLKNADGAVKKIAVWIMENTAQVAARLQLQEAEETARLALVSANLGSYDLAFDSNTLTADQRFRDIWNIEHPTLTREELLSQIHPEDAGIREKAHALSLVTGQLDYEARIVWKDGSQHWVRIAGKVLFKNEKPFKLVGVVQDITAAVTANQKVEESEKTLRTMILQSPVAMCILRGPGFVIEIANDKMLQLWDRSFAQVAHLPIVEALPEMRTQGYEKMLLDVYNTGIRFEANESQVTLFKNDNASIGWLHFVYQPLQNSEGQVTDILCVAIEVTEQVNARQRIEEIVTERTQELALANRNLQKSNEELAQFAYITSHDLQEPIRKISVFTQMLEESLRSGAAEKSQAYLQKIGNSSARMHNLINDVLAYSKLSGQQDVFEPVNLNAVLDQVKDDFDLLLTQKIAVVISDNLPVVQAVPLQMHQLFTNLLGNALKFTQTGIIPRIEIRSYPATAKDYHQHQLDPDRYFFHIEIRDNGIGLKPEYAQQIFEIFKRLHKKSEYEGTGIGLAMCKKIALNHGGDINADGSSESGAVMNVFLPGWVTPRSV